MRKIASTLWLILMAAAAGLVVYFLINIFLKSSNPEQVKLVVESGQGVDEITGWLEQNKVIRDKLVFKAYLFLRGRYDQIQPGLYLIEPQTGMKTIVDTLTPDPETKIETEIKIIEGWTSAEIAQYLESEGLVTAADFYTAAQSTDSRDILPEEKYEFLKDKPAERGLEGYLFPDTYRVYTDSAAADILKKMLDNFGQKLDAQLRAEIASQGKTVFEVVTLASIIEKEVRLPAEKKLAAGIFSKRLAEGIALQSDATVNFVTGKDTTQPSLEDLQVNSEYNTYLYKGLPPGPICSPGLESLKAVIYPVESDYLYFLTKPDGTAVFSETYEEHLKNKERYYE